MRQMLVLVFIQIMGVAAVEPGMSCIIHGTALVLVIRVIPTPDIVKNKVTAFTAIISLFPATCY